MHSTVWSPFCLLVFKSLNDNWTKCKGKRYIFICKETDFRRNLQIRQLECSSRCKEICGTVHADNTFPMPSRISAYSDVHHELLDEQASR